MPPSPAEEAWALFWRIFSADKPRRMAVFSELGLSFQQAMALGHLDADEPLPMSSLAGALQCDNSNVTGIVDRLEARGLIERRPSPKDRRVKLLVLTEEGARLRESAYRQMTTPPPAIAALPLKHKRALRDALRATFDQQVDEAAGAPARAPAAPSA